jgi:hypothetical protein
MLVATVTAQKKAASARETEWDVCIFDFLRAVVKGGAEGSEVGVQGSDTGFKA